MTPHRDELERSIPERIDSVDFQPPESIRETESPTQDREVERVRERTGPVDVAASSRDAALLEPDVVGNFRTRWDEVQAGFVDEPRRAVEQANDLVTDAIQRLGQIFDSERGRLEAQWDRDGDVSTEDLRLALQRYRAFFSRLLSV